MKKIIFFLLMLITLIACENSSKSSDKAVEINNKVNNEIRSFVVLETIDVASYVYILGKENGAKYWYATNVRDVNKGDTFFYDNPLVMKDFYSRELDRPFDEILFLSRIAKNPIELNKPKTETVSKANGKIKTKQIEISIDKPDNTISIAQLFKQKDVFKGQEVIIKGEVVKFSPQIMNTNWIHIQDGTSFNGKYDLTITSQENVNVGDILTFKGFIAVDKDFGYGYFYEFLMEEAEIIE
ncbi:MAG: hypothetical protein DRI74_00425 [Bacteroidetes bacterium]|nr:MAG: hypothetical protein DRI74_00425 [Bacteroidota bacterium]